MKKDKELDIAYFLSFCIEQYKNSHRMERRRRHLGPVALYEEFSDELNRKEGKQWQ